MVAETMSGRLEVLVRLLGVVLFVQLASEGAVVVDALQAREGTPSSLGLHRPAAPGPSTGLTRDATVARYYGPIYGRVSVCLVCLSVCHMPAAFDKTCTTTQKRRKNSKDVKKLIRTVPEAT